MTRGLLAGVALLIMLSTGCASDPTQGYAAASAYSSDVQTVAIPISENKTYERGLEFELTDALIKEIQRRTPYKVVPQSRADTILLAQIQHVDLRQLSKSTFTGLTEEAVVGVTIDFEWRDLRSNQLLVKRLAFTGHGLFLPSQPSGESIDLGRFAAVQQLARDVVAELQGQW